MKILTINQAHRCNDDNVVLYIYQVLPMIYAISYFHVCFFNVSSEYDYFYLHQSAIAFCPYQDTLQLQLAKWNCIYSVDTKTSLASSLATINFNLCWHALYSWMLCTALAWPHFYTKTCIAILILPKKNIAWRICIPTITS